MRVIIAGSRTIKDYRTVLNAIEKAQRAGFQITEEVSGAATGVDKLGEQWARNNDIPIKSFPADWDNYGRKAGFMRNVQMVKYADAAILIWDGESKGTLHTLNEIKKAQKPYYIELARGDV